jgi:hypothetical protein
MPSQHVWRTAGANRKVPISSPDEKIKCKVCKQLVKPLPSGKLPEHAVPLSKKGRWHWCTENSK